MGQIVGTPVVNPLFHKCSKFPKSAIDSLWKSYNLLGEAWGLNLNDVKSIFRGADYIVHKMGLTDNDISDFFTGCDTDCNGLVDALEMIVTIGLISGMDSVEKVFFVFAVYDFDSKGTLSFDEVSLLLRSIIKACSKIFPHEDQFQRFQEQEIEFQAMTFFEQAKKSPSQRLNAHEFQRGCFGSGVLVNWMDLLTLPSGWDPAEAQSMHSITSHVASLHTSVEFPALPRHTVDSTSSDLVKGTSLYSSSQAQTSSGKSSAPPPPTIPWYGTADMMCPEEMKVALPKNAPCEDQIELFHVHGLGNTEVATSSTSSSAFLSASRLPAVYSPQGGILYPASHFLIHRPLVGKTSAASSAGGEDGNEKGSFSWEQSPSITLGGPSPPPFAPQYGFQEIRWEHQGPITSLEISEDGQFVVTTERLEDGPGQSERNRRQRVIIWKFVEPTSKKVVEGSEEGGGEGSGGAGIGSPKDLKVHAVVTLHPEVTVHGTSLSTNGRYLSVITETILPSESPLWVGWIIDLVLRAPLTRFPIPLPVISAASPSTSSSSWSPLIRLARNSSFVAMALPSLKPTITTSFSSTYASDFSCLTMRFYVDDPVSPLGLGGLHAFQARDPLYQGASSSSTASSTPAAYEGAGTTSLVRFQGEDDFLSGTTSGHVLVWKQRSCVAAVQVHAEGSAVVGLHFHLQGDRSFVVTSGLDGRIVLTRVRKLAPVSGATSSLKGKKGGAIPSLPPSWECPLEVVSAFHTSSLQVPVDSLRSVFTSQDGLRMLVTSSVGKLLEVSLWGPEQATYQAQVQAALPPGNGGTAEEVTAAATSSSPPPPPPAFFLGQCLHPKPLALRCHSSGSSLCHSIRSPLGSQIITLGGDGSVSLWSLEESGSGGGSEDSGGGNGNGTGGTRGPFECLQSMQVESPVNRVAMSTNNLMVLSCHSMPSSTTTTTSTTTSPDKQGRLLIFSTPDWKFLMEVKETEKEVITDLKFSPADQSLLVCSLSGKAWVLVITPSTSPESPQPTLTVRNQFSMPFPVFKADFTQDGLFVRVQGFDQQLAVVDVVNSPGTQVTLPEILATLGSTFVTSSVAYSWETKGILSQLPPRIGWGGNNGRDPQSLPTCDRKNQLWVAGQDTGAVWCHRLPCAHPVFYSGSQASRVQRKLPYFRSPVTILGFSEDGSKLYSAGRDDGVLVISKVTFDADEADPNMPSLEVEPNSEFGQSTLGDLGAEEGAGEEADANEGGGEEGEEGEEGGKKLPKVLPDLAFDDDDRDGVELLNHWKLPLEEHWELGQGRRGQDDEEDHSVGNKEGGEPSASASASASKKESPDPSSNSDDPWKEVKTWVMNLDLDVNALRCHEEVLSEYLESTFQTTKAPASKVMEVKNAAKKKSGKKGKKEGSSEVAGAAGDSVPGASSTSEGTVPPPSLSQCVDLPSENLTPLWIHGYSGQECRQGVYYGPLGDLIYPCGRHIIFYDKVRHRQRVITSPHSEVITCVDLQMSSFLGPSTSSAVFPLAPNGRNLGVSGSRGPGKLSVAIWDSSTGEILRYLRCGSVYSLSAVKISSCGTYVFAAGQDNSHTIFFFHVPTGQLLARIPTGSAKIWCMALSDPSTLLPSAAALGQLRLLVGTANGFLLLDVTCGGKMLRLQRGYFGAGQARSGVRCVAMIPPSWNAELNGPFGGPEFVLGLSNGGVAIVNRNERKVSQVFPVLKKGSAINSILVQTLRMASAEEGSPVYKIVVAGVMGAIKVLDPEGQILTEFNPYWIRSSSTAVSDGNAAATATATATAMNESETDYHPWEFGLHAQGMLRGYRSLCLEKFGRKLLFSTSAGEISELDFENGRVVNDRSTGPLISSHYRGSLTALAVHPLRQEILTAGQDKLLQLWCLRTHRRLQSFDLPLVANCAIFAPNGHLIVMGLSGQDPLEADPRAQQELAKKRQKMWKMSMKKKDENENENNNNDDNDNNNNNDDDSQKKKKNQESEEDSKMVGKIQVISYLQGELRSVYVTSVSSSEVSALCFTPDGSKLFVGCQDGSVTVLDPLNNFAVITTLSEHEQPIVALDISRDGQILVSTGNRGEIIHWDSGLMSPLNDERRNEFLQRQLLPPTEVSEAALRHAASLNQKVATTEGSRWFVRQGLVGSDSLGLFGPHHRWESLTSLHENQQGTCWIVGDRSGQLHLYARPSLSLQAPSRPYSLHAPGGRGVTKCFFTAHDEHVVSIGSVDRTIVVWKVLSATTSSESTTQTLPRTDEGGVGEGENQDGEEVGDKMIVVATSATSASSATTAITATSGLSNFEHRMIKSPLSLPYLWSYWSDSQRQGWTELLADPGEALGGFEASFLKVQGQLDVRKAEYLNNLQQERQGKTKNKGSPSPTSSMSVHFNSLITMNAVKSVQVPCSAIAKDLDSYTKKKALDSSHENYLWMTRFSRGNFTMPLACYSGSEDYITSTGKFPMVWRRVHGQLVSLPLTVSPDSGLKWHEFTSSSSSSSSSKGLAGVTAQYSLTYPDISTMCVSPCRRLLAVALGPSWEMPLTQRRNYPSQVLIFRTGTYDPLYCFGGAKGSAQGQGGIFSGGIASMSFSEDLAYLAVLGQDVRHTLTIFHAPSLAWDRGDRVQQIYQGPTSLSELSLVTFLAVEKSLPGGSGGGSGGEGGGAGSPRVSARAPMMTSPRAGVSSSSTSATPPPSGGGSSGGGSSTSMELKYRLAIGGLGGLQMVEIQGRNVRQQVIRYDDGSDVVGVTSLASGPTSTKVIVGNSFGELWCWTLQVEVSMEATLRNHAHDTLPQFHALSVLPNPPALPDWYFTSFKMGQHEGPISCLTPFSLPWTPPALNAFAATSSPGNGNVLHATLPINLAATGLTPSPTSSSLLFSQSMKAPLSTSLLQESQRKLSTPQALAGGGGSFFPAGGPPPPGDLAGVFSASWDSIKMWRSSDLTLVREIPLTSLREIQVFSSNFHRPHTIVTPSTTGTATTTTTTTTATATATATTTSSPSLAYVTSLAVDAGAHKLLVTFSAPSLQWMEVSLDTLATTELLSSDSRRIDHLVSVPGQESHYAVTVTPEDGRLNLWDLRSGLGSGRRRIVASLAYSLAHRVTCLHFLTPQLLGVGLAGTDAQGQAGSLLVVHVDPQRPSMEIKNRLSNVGKSGISQIRLGPLFSATSSASSSTTSSLLALGSLDGQVYLVSISNSDWLSQEGRLTLTAVLAALPYNVPISGLDFSQCGRYLRAYGVMESGDRIVASEYFDLASGVQVPVEAGANNNAAPVNTTVVEKSSKLPGYGLKMIEGPQFEEFMKNASLRWTSYSSLACPELQGLYLPGMKRSWHEGLKKKEWLQLQDLTVSADLRFAAASYSDGFIRVFRLPALEQPCKPLLELQVQYFGPLKLSLFQDSTTQKYRLLSYGLEDASMQLWDLDMV